MKIEESYNRFLKLTNDPGAAATLVLAEVTAREQPQDALTVKQAAASLGVSANTVYDLCKTGTLKHQKIGRTVRIRAADLEKFDSTPKHTLQCLKV